MVCVVYTVVVVKLFWTIGFLGYTLYSETAPNIFLEPITNLKTIYLKDPSIDINKLKPKDLYYLLLLPEAEKPKALIKKQNITKESCMNLKSLKCNPRIKQHIFHQINDIVPTNERL